MQIKCFKLHIATFPPSSHPIHGFRTHSLVVKYLPSKQMSRVRFAVSADAHCLQFLFPAREFFLSAHCLISFCFSMATWKKMLCHVLHFLSFICLITMTRRKSLFFHHLAVITMSLVEESQKKKMEKLMHGDINFNLAL